MKRALKYLGIALLVAAVGFLLVFANAFFGNPLSKFLARQGGKAYIQETYTHLELDIETVGYNFKDGNYFIRLQSPTSPDTHFFLYADSFGHISYDSYDSYVTSGRNTYDRITQEYRDLTRAIIDSETFPYNREFGSGSLEFLWEKGDASEYGFTRAMSELELDGEYDVLALGAEIGVLTIYIEETDLTDQRATEITSGIKTLFDEAGIPFRILNMTLRPPKLEDGTRTDEHYYVILDYSELHSDGLEERVAASNQARQEYFSYMDSLEKGT